MRGPRTVLGDRDAHTVQSAMTASIQSMRRSVNHRMEPASVRNCVGCGVAPIVDMAPSDLYRCSVTHDRFLWVCGACLNETKNEDADLFFFSRRNVSLFFFPSSLNKQRHMSWAPPKVMVTAGAPSHLGRGREIDLHVSCRRTLHRRRQRPPPVWRRSSRAFSFCFC